MKHIILCREYPPAPPPAGGIGTYASNISKLLAENGEQVHVISQLWEGAESKVEEKCNGSLIIHRVSVEYVTDEFEQTGRFAAVSNQQFDSLDKNLAGQIFSWNACLLSEKLIEDEGIDIVEGQEFEAPLYYIQIRRALGLGSKKCPPCIVHLHTPTEFISRYNEWNYGVAAVINAKRYEDYTIATADALLCPSRYLAAQAELHYGLTTGSIRTIPLPIGDNRWLKRDPGTWEHGSICYIGRLERRKGIIEWIDAIVDVAPKYPAANFDFIGAVILDINENTGRKLLEKRIPSELRPRIVFHGEQQRSNLNKLLSKSRIAAVPSRWENFPNTCIEAMSSGIPVIASHEGGMAEMIKDNQTGWLTRKSGSEGLAEALKRALDTSPMKLAEMGKLASSDIFQLCDNQRIVEKHMEFRHQVANQGPRTSIRLPSNLPWALRPIASKTSHKKQQGTSNRGLGLVVNCLSSDGDIKDLAQSLLDQTSEPACVAFVINELSNKMQDLKQSLENRENGWQIINQGDGSISSAKNTAIELILDSRPDILGFAFLDCNEFLHPDFVAICESILIRNPEIGILSFWTKNTRSEGKITIRPCPAFPYQWLVNDAANFSVIRRDALIEAGCFRSSMNHGYEDWDLFNAVMSSGWTAVTIPQVLGISGGRDESTSHMKGILLNDQMRTKMLDRFDKELFGDVKDIILLFGADSRLWLERNSRHLWIYQTDLDWRLKFFILLKFILEPLYKWGMKRGWTWMAPTADKIKQILIRNVKD